jgi:hypothetical protein
VRIIVFIFFLLFIGCSTKQPSIIKLTDKEKSIKISKKGNFLFYAYLKNGNEVKKISKEILDYSNNEEIIRVYDNGYFPIYDDIYGVEKCNYILLNQEKHFCRSFYTVKASDNAKNFMAKIILKTAGGKIFSNYKFKSSIIEAKLPQIKNLLEKNDFDTLGVIRAKSIPINKIVISKQDYTLDKFIVFDEKNNIKDIVNMNDLKEKDIFESVSILTKRLMNVYLKPRTHINITTSIPPKIPKPKLPLPPKLIKNEFETKAMFQKRVHDAMQKREEEIQKLQTDFRKAVEARNQKVKELKQFNLQNIKEIEEEQSNKKRNVKKYIPYFTSIAMQFLINNLNLKNLQYDAENMLMYADLVSKNKSYQKKIYLKIPLSDAQKFKNKKYFNPIITYKYNNSKLTLTDIKVDNYHAKLSQIDFKPQPMIVNLKDIKLNSDMKQTVFEPQNPNLKDKYRVVGSMITEDVDMTITNFQDDLPNLLAKISIHSKDPKKWLFVIGAEEYDNTDNVTYSKRSAETFLKVAKKSLGVTARNTYALIGDKATSGAIEDKLNRMLENVKEGDSIYFFYSGHGIPVLPNRVPYLLPKDKIPDYIGRNSFFKLNNIYNLLSNSKASKVIAVMDSCFSGSTDGRSVFKGVAGSVLIPKKVTFDHDKMVVLTAGRDKQFSNMYPQKGHRLFSYFVMKSLLEGKRGVKDIYNAIYPSVKSVSNGFGDLKRQEPTIEGNEELSF